MALFKLNFVVNGDLTDLFTKLNLRARALTENSEFSGKIQKNKQIQKKLKSENSTSMPYIFRENSKNQQIH